MADDTFPRSLTAFGHAMVGGNRAEILNNGDEIFPGMTEAIRNARKTVNFETYIFKNDKAGEIFTAALVDAARRGVEVRVLVDATGSKFAGPLLARMRQAGVKATKYHQTAVELYKIRPADARRSVGTAGQLPRCFCVDDWPGTTATKGGAGQMVGSRRPRRRCRRASRE